MTSHLTPHPYHRLQHLTPQSARWWSPLAMLGAAGGLYLSVLVLLFVVLVVVVVAQPATDQAPDMGALMAEDPADPLYLILMLGSIALMLPAVVLGARWGGRSRGTVHSVAGRFRWGMLLRGTAMVLPCYAVIYVALFVADPPADLTPPPEGMRTVAAYAVLLLLVPLQCAAEEYAFRALPQQMLGTWLRSPWWGIVAPVPLFMLGHGYNWTGQIDIAVFALCAGVLVWKSGGMELAIVMHAANNLVLFVLGTFTPSSLEQGEVDPRLLLVSLPLTIGTTVALSLWVSRTHGLRLLEPVRGVGRGRRTPAETQVEDPQPRQDRALRSADRGEALHVGGGARDDDEVVR